MRNFFIYARSKDNQFFSCAVQVHCFEGQDSDELLERIHAAARKRFEMIGNPLPPDTELVRLRAVPDARCDMDDGGYEPVPPRRYKLVKA
jgi:hypothetical protein